jgi:hypothetical protein
MTDNNTNPQTEQQLPKPNPDLQAFGRLIGSWQVTGGVTGTVTYEWMEGGFFLIQQVDIERYDHHIKGFEVIGHLQPFGEAPSAEIKSRYYDTTGNTFDYVYEVVEDALIIWGGEKGSPAYYKGTFSADGNTLTGGWSYPGGGGYESVATRTSK